MDEDLEIGATGPIHPFKPTMTDEEIRRDCICVAAGNWLGSKDPDEIVKSANKFYNFIKNGQVP